MSFFQTVHTYRELRQIIEAFAREDGPLSFVVVVGNPGIGKTNTFRRMCEGALVLECNTTAFGLYTGLYEEREAELVVLDDVETLLSTPRGVNLLKALCQTDRVKRLSWNTTAADNAKIPRSFEIQARVLIFANEISAGGKNFAAVMDRGHGFTFAPTPLEVHAEVADWIERGETRTVIDPEVFAFIGQHLDEITMPTFRDYVRASEQRAAGLDWRAGLQARWQSDPKLAAVAEIMRLREAGDPTLQTADQRVERFADWGHGGRTSYMRYQKKWLAAHGLSRVPKVGQERDIPEIDTTPAISATDTGDIFEQLTAWA